MKKIKCPLCLGKGVIVLNRCCGKAPIEMPCNGCEGRGWIEASGDSEREEYKEKA